MLWGTLPGHRAPGFLPCSREPSRGKMGGRPFIWIFAALTQGGGPELIPLDSVVSWPCPQVRSHREKRKENLDPGPRTLKQAGLIQAPGLMNNPRGAEPGELHRAPGASGSQARVSPCGTSRTATCCQERREREAAQMTLLGLVCLFWWTDG